MYLVHEVTVDTYLGSGAHGDVFADTSDPVACMRDDKRQIVRSSDGTEMVSETTLIMRLANAPAFEPGSIVHLPHRDATVISAAERRDGGLGAWQHLQVTLT